MNKSDKQTDKQTDKRRRKFLHDSLAGGTGAVLAAAAPGIAIASTVDDSPAADEHSKGYRLTQHIIDYYKTAAS